MIHHIYTVIEEGVVIIMHMHDEGEEQNKEKKN